MPTALITGITGQDGGYLAELLTGQGWTVHGILRAQEEPPAHLTAATLHEADLLDNAGLEALFIDIAPDEVYNLAGVSSVARSWDDPVPTARVNGEVVARLLELIWNQTHPVRFLQASSA